MKRRRATLVLVLIVGLAAVGGWLIAPNPPRLGRETTGDRDLARQVRRVVHDTEGRLGLAVALVEDGRVRTVGLGRTSVDASRPVSPSTQFEIGSVAKAFTGMLLADLADRRLVHPDNQLARLLPGVRFSDPAVETASLAELASHRSGLPRLPPDVHTWILGFGYQLLGTNPYAGSGPGELISAAADTSAVRPQGEFGYSNFGMAVLGQALAHRAGTDYPTLLERQILDPLGMHATVVVETRMVDTGAPLPDGRAHGYRANGMPVAPWRGMGYAPAGVGVWSSVEDLGQLLDAVLADTAAGVGATHPRFATGMGERIGFGWFTSRHGAHEVTWHDGGTGGFRSYLGFDRATGRGVAVLANTTAPVDTIGLRLLGVPTDDVDRVDGWSFLPSASVPAVAAGSLCLYAAAASVLAARRLRRGRKRTDRVAVAALAAEVVLALALAHTIAAWTVLPTALWTASAAVATGGLAVLGHAWARLPVRAGGRAWVRWLGMILVVAIAVTFLALRVS